MKTNRLIAIALTALAAASLQQASAQFLTLTGTSYTNTFDTLEVDQALPNGWVVYTGATVSSPGAIGTFNNTSYTAASNTWRTTSGRFANQASTYSYIGGTNFLGTESTAIQQAEPNRCLAVRQVSGTDVGVAFVVKLTDTLNRQNFHMLVDFMNLDPTSTRTATWTVDYGIGLAPTTFTPVAAWVNTSGTFNTYHTNITFPNGTIDNIDPSAGPVWIRVVVLTPTSGSGNRETSGMDNFGLTWDPGAACAPAHVTGNPAPVAGYVNGNAAFTVGATGTAPRSYVWLKNGSTVLSDDGHFSGTTTPNLAITTLVAGDAGTYSCIVSNVCSDTVYSQTSGGAALTVSTPPAVSINYLHTLVDTTSWAPTNSSLLYSATGIITTATNTTSANTASYYLQDGTGGINLFCTFGSTFRPALGDEVTVFGFLNAFQGNLELEADLSNPAQGVTVLSNNVANFPVAKVVPWDNLYQGGTNANINYNTLGSIVMLTNVYFGTNAGTLTYSTNNLTLVVTNSSGQIARVFLPCTQVNDLTNRTIPSFAYGVQGPLVAASVGYDVTLTSWADLLTSPLSININRAGTSSTITWTAVPLTYSYTVRGATSVAGPYSVLATNLKFTDANGTYTDTGASGDFKFYRVTSP